MFYYIKWCYYSLSDTMISCQFKVIKTRRKLILGVLKDKHSQ